MWTIVITTALVTLFAVLVYVNLTPNAPSTSELPELDYTARDAQFRREINALFGHSLVDGNRIDTLQNGVEIFPAMLEAIRGARQSINFETFVYWKGDIAREFSHALAERARAGVDVNVILDWVGSRPMDQSLIDHMSDSGVEVEIYRPLAWYSIDRVNHRTHRKILVVDGRIGFTGGVGIAEEWTGDAHDEEHYRDTHYRVEGIAVAQLQGAFNENWQKVRGEILTGERYFPPLETQGDVAAQFIASAPGTGNESARTLYLHAISAARDSLLIGTPYFVPDSLVLEALIAARRRGVDVKVLVPGRQTDSNLAHFASQCKWGEMIEEGIEIYEYRPTFYHAKLLIVDDFWVLTGSTNFDSRSFRLNDEINLNVMGEAFAREQRAAFEADLRNSIKIPYQRWANRPLRHKLVEPLALLVQGQL